MAETIARENHRLLEARLLISRPGEVFNELQKHGSQADSSWSFDAWDQTLERSLLARNEALIDLALARYARDKDIVRELYEKACSTTNAPNEAYKKGLRVACLSNHIVWVSDIKGFPQDVIGTEATWKVLSEAADYHDEASALLENPQIDSKLLNALYRREEPFASLPENHWTYLIRISLRNPSIGEQAIFRVLEVAPSDQRWREMLVPLLERLHPTFAAPPESLRQVLERWSSDNSGEDDDRTLFYNDHNYLSLPDKFRCVIAALYGGDKAILKDGRTSDDAAMRCAFYGNAPLTLAEMKAGDERDGGLFTLAVLFNDHVLGGTRSTRNALEQEYLDDEELYRKRCETLSFRLTPLDKWREDERRKRVEQESEKFRFFVLVGLGVLLAFAFIQMFSRAAGSNDLIPAVLWTLVGVLIVGFSYGARFGGSRRRSQK